VKLPNGNRATVTDEKLLGYLLNEGHPDQPGHAELFRLLLGITPANAEVLRSALLEAAAGSDVTVGTRSPFGAKYEIRFDMTGPRKAYTILSVWIIENGQDVPRLITAFIE
jgi:hypothetical protein